MLFGRCLKHKRSTVMPVLGDQHHRVPVHLLTVSVGLITACPKQSAGPTHCTVTLAVDEINEKWRHIRSHCNQTAIKAPQAPTSWPALNLFVVVFFIFIGSLSGAEMLSFSNLLKVKLHWTAPCLLKTR